MSPALHLWVTTLSTGPTYSYTAQSNPDSFSTVFCSAVFNHSFSKGKENVPLFQVKIVDWHSFILENQQNLWESLCICCCIHLRDKLSNLQSLEFIFRKCEGLVMDFEEVVRLKITVSFCHVSIILCPLSSFSSVELLKSALTLTLSPFLCLSSTLSILSCKN